ncbi:MAG: hypothetical protein L0271_08705, partial [Gemmatimonadetes bacterium]|nr:hypothetical protein [Gemmatimonadota bacterium]
MVTLLGVAACQETPIGPEDGDRARSPRGLSIEEPRTEATTDVAEPGTGGSVLQSSPLASLTPAVTVQGKVVLSVDGTGTTGPSSTVQVEKPAGATVRGAYLAAASTGFSGFVIPDGAVT